MPSFDFLCKDLKNYLTHKSSVWISSKIKSLLKCIDNLSFPSLLLLCESKNNTEWFISIILMKKIIIDIYLIFTFWCATKVTLCIVNQGHFLHWISNKISSNPSSYVLENSLTFPMSTLISWGCFLPSHVSILFLLLAIQPLWACVSLLLKKSVNSCLAQLMGFWVEISVIIYIKCIMYGIF